MIIYKRDVNVLCCICVFAHTSGSPHVSSHKAPCVAEAAFRVKAPWRCRTNVSAFALEMHRPDTVMSTVPFFPFLSSILCFQFTFLLRQHTCPASSFFPLPVLSCFTCHLGRVFPSALWRHLALRSLFLFSERPGEMDPHWMALIFCCVCFHLAILGVCVCVLSLCSYTFCTRQCSKLLWRKPSLWESRQFWHWIVARIAFIFSQQWVVTLHYTCMHILHARSRMHKTMQNRWQLHMLWFFPTRSISCFGCFTKNYFSGWYFLQ